MSAREGESEWGRGGSLGVHFGGRRGMAGRQAHMAAAHSNGGGMVGAWKMRWHFLRQVASDGRGKVEADFGPAMGPKAKLKPT